jgi:hypothetical protein
MDFIGPSCLKTHMHSAKLVEIVKKLILVNPEKKPRLD